MNQYSAIETLTSADSAFCNNTININNNGKRSLTTNNVENSGWFYDTQRANPITSVRLLANTKWDDNEWKSEKNNPYLYLLKPCTSILAEDFSIQVANTWTDVGSDPIGDLVNSTTHGVAPYANFANNILDKMHDGTLKFSEKTKKKIDEHIITKKLASGVEKLGKARGFVNKLFGGEYSDKNGNVAHDKLDELMNSNLMMRGAQFAYYGGTGVDIQNLVMRFTLFPTWYGSSFISVTEQLKELYPYFIGQLSNTIINSTYLEDHFGLNRGTVDNINSYFYLQTAPAGYQATLAQNIYQDNVNIKGTFELQFGARYRVNNLLSSNASFIFSKQLVKDPTGKDDLTPLFCDVTLTFKPCTKYTAESLESFVGYQNGELKNILKKKVEESSTQTTT